MEENKKISSNLKTKIVMAISIGLSALILTMVIFIQFKTIDETDVAAIETMRETELRTELESWKTKFEEVEQKYKDVQGTIAEYSNELTTNKDASKLIETELEQTKDYLGLTKLKGEGIEITLKDNEDRIIEYTDLLSLVNELKAAGAEAISINGERIVSRSEITLVEFRLIVINTRRISEPFVVTAIGNKTYLESAITIKGGYIDKTKAAGKTIEYKVLDSVSVPAYNMENGKQLQFDYAKINESKGEEKQ